MASPTIRSPSAAMSNGVLVTIPRSKSISPLVQAWRFTFLTGCRGGCDIAGVSVSAKEIRSGNGGGFGFLAVEMVQGVE